MSHDPRLIDPRTLGPRRDAVQSSGAAPEAAVALIPVHGITRVDVRGKDTLTFLQSKLSVDVKRWPDTGGAYGYSVDINGRVLFDAHAVQIGADHVRIWSGPGLEKSIVEALDKYIIMEDVALDAHPETAAWMLVGESTAALDARLGVQFPKPNACVEHEGAEIVAFTRAARPARLLVGDTDALVARLRAADVPSLTWEDWRDWEIEEGFVRTGVDLFFGETIPLEAGADLGVEYNKGCYMGQEVIERLRSRGTPNREYRRVQVDAPADALATLREQLPVEIVQEDGRSAGSMTSLSKRGAGIAVIRRRALQDDAPLFVGDANGPSLRRVGDVR